jgi:VHL beta domain
VNPLVYVTPRVRTPRSCVQAPLPTLSSRARDQCAANTYTRRILGYYMCYACCFTSCTSAANIATFDMAKTERRPSAAMAKYARFNRSTHEQGVVEQTYAVFCNASSEPLKFIWIDFEHRPVLYSTVKPGSEYWIYTYNTHTWVIEDALGNIWMSYIFGASFSPPLSTKVKRRSRTS